MRIETSSADREAVENNLELRREDNKKKKKSGNNRKSKKSKSKKSMASVVQNLFDTCKEVFATGEAGYVPPPADIERLRQVLDGMRLADVGLTPDMPYFMATLTQQPPPVTYVHLHHCPKFSIGIFCLPPSAVIPLHNHPGMTVFGKLLHGEMHIKSYDWVPNPSRLPELGLRLAKVHVDSEFTASSTTSILYPAAGGNMHCFTALTSCAVLDVLGPPYCDAQGRPCTYYQDFPYATVSGEARLLPDEEQGGYAWLREREKPDSFIVVGAVYSGPEIVET